MLPFPAAPPPLPLRHPRQYDHEEPSEPVQTPVAASTAHPEPIPSRSASTSKPRHRPHTPTFVQLRNEAYDHVGVGEMEADQDESFLPRIVGIFFARLDPGQSGGSIVTYQVPANLISTSSNSPRAPISQPSSRSQSRVRSLSAHPATATLLASSSTPPSHTTPAQSLRSSSHNQHNQQPLLSFAPLSEMLLPKDPLCGQLITITSGPYKIQSFPVAITDTKYKQQRNEFRFNVCWVFDRWKYEGGEFESVVKKVAKVLKACEESKSLLSGENALTTISQILEQLFEDLNSYAETSIPINESNSIEIKIFPLLSNPIKVEDWHVPLPLIDLAKMKEPNWDLTMEKVVKYIDGVRHVKKIAECADATSTFTRICIEHLLYYQGAMLLDIFQYANMYTVMPAIQYLSEASHVMEECAAYSMRDSRLPYPSWPTLLRLYTSLRPGLTVSDWMAIHHIAALGIDVRRFVSFGVIKGFLRRVHRWPIFRKAEHEELLAQVAEENQQQLGDDAGESGFSTRTSSTTDFPTYVHQDPHQYQSYYSLPSQGSEPENTYTANANPNVNSSAFNSSAFHVHGLGHHKPPNPPTPKSSLPLSAKPIPVTNSKSFGAGGGKKTRSSRPSKYPWGNDEWPRGATVDLLDGDLNSDALCVRFQVGWEGEMGLEKALRRLAREEKGVLELVYR